MPNGHSSPRRKPFFTTALAVLHYLPTADFENKRPFNATHRATRLRGFLFSFISPYESVPASAAPTPPPTSLLICRPLPRALELRSLSVEGKRCKINGLRSALWARAVGVVELCPILATAGSGTQKLYLVHCKLYIRIRSSYICMTYC